MDKIQSIPKALISETMTLDYTTPISKVSSYLKKYPAIIISKNKEYYGVVDTRTIYRSKHDLSVPTNEKAERFVVKAPKITNSTSVDDLIYYFYRSGVRALPYTSGNKITGVLERKTLLKVLLSLNVLEDMKVNEAMTTPILAIDSMANVSQAYATMRDRNVNRLIVIKENKFLGLITNHDIINHYSKTTERLPEMNKKAYSPSNVPISSVMESNVSSIEYNRSLSDAVRDMVENKISSLVVLKNSNPIGMLTVSDVLESIVARKKVEERKVFMSGFDAETYPYEDEAREELKSFIDSVEKLSGIDVDYVTLKIKKSHSKRYEMQIRLSLGKHGIISMHNSKYLFEDTLKDLLTKLKHKVIKEKESIISHKKVNTLMEEME